MAYTPNGLKDEEQQGGAQAPGAPSAPTISGPSIGSTASVGGSMVGNQSASPAGQSSGSGAGTGFVNSGRYLDANKQAGQQVQQEATQTRDKETKNFATAKSGFDAQVKSQSSPTVDINSLVNQIMAPTQGAPQPIGQAMTGGLGPINRDSNQGPQARAPSRAPTNPQQNTQGPNPEAVTQAQGILQKVYQGPEQFTYAQTGEQKQLQGLANAASVGETIAAKTGPLASYNPSLSALDQLIYGNNAASQIATTGADNKTMLEGQAAGAKDSNNYVGNVKRNIADQKQKLTGALGQRVQDVQTAASGRAAAAMAQQGRDQDQGLIRDPTTGKVVQAPTGQVRGAWEAGSGNATGAQFLSGGDVRGLNTIGTLLGDANLANTKASDPWVSGRYTTADAQAQQAAGGTPTAPVGDIAQTLHLDPLSPEQRSQQAADKTHREALEKKVSDETRRKARSQRSGGG